MDAVAVAGPAAAPATWPRHAHRTHAATRALGGGSGGGGDSRPAQPAATLAAPLLAPRASDNGHGGDQNERRAASPQPDSPRPPPMEVNVAANNNPGIYLVEQRAVRCLCPNCVELRRDPANAGYIISPTEFERHSGIPAAKKWRFSIKVAHSGEPEICLGRWLEMKGLDQKVPKRAPHGATAATRPAAAAAAHAHAHAHHATPNGAAHARGGTRMARCSFSGASSGGMDALEAARLGLELLSSGGGPDQQHAWDAAHAHAHGGGSDEEDAAGGARRGHPQHHEDATWMRSPRGVGVNGGANGSGGGASPPRVSSGDARGSDAEEGVIRVGAEFQATLPDWRARPGARGAAAVAELARTGPRGPTEAKAVAMAVEERARAESLPPDATDDLWERREPALALERAHRHRRMPGWMAGEQFVHAMAGGHVHLGYCGGLGSGHGARGLEEEEEEGGNASDHGGTRHARPKRVSSNSAHSGSTVPLPHAALLALQQQQQQAQQALVQQAAALHRATCGGATGAAAAAAAAATSGVVPLQHALAVATAQPATPHVVEWRAAEGREVLEAALVLGGQVYVGRLASRGPLASWLPLPPHLQQAAAAVAGGTAPAPAPQVACPEVKVEEPVPITAAGPDPAATADAAHRCCTLCQGAAAAGLGPLMPVQIQNGQLDWVHRDCALWSPEVSVDGTGRLVGLAAAVRRGLDTACTLCGHRGATLPCYAPSCGQELHLPCARAMGCQLSNDAGPGGRPFVACPAHHPSGPLTPGDAANARSEAAARDAALAASAAAAAAAALARGSATVGGTTGRGAAAAAASAADDAVEEMEAAAELLTGIKRGSLLGSGDGGDGGAARRRRSSMSGFSSGPGAGTGAAAHGAHAGFQQQQQQVHAHQQLPKRRRSTSADGCSDGTRDGLSNCEEPAGQPVTAADAVAGGAADARWRGGARGSGGSGAAAAQQCAANEHTSGGGSGHHHHAAKRRSSHRGDDASDAGDDGGGWAAGDTETPPPPLPHDVAALLAAAGASSGGGSPLPGSPTAAAALLASRALGGGTGHAGRPGRCAVCIVQRKGKCGTESAPKKCMRRLQAEAEARQRAWQKVAAARRAGADPGSGLLSAAEAAAEEAGAAAAAAAAAAAGGEHYEDPGSEDMMEEADDESGDGGGAEPAA